MGPCPIAGKSVVAEFHSTRDFHSSRLDVSRTEKQPRWQHNQPPTQRKVEIACSVGLQVPLAGYYVSIDHRVHLYASYQRHLYHHVSITNYAYQSHIYIASVLPNANGYLLCRLWGYLDQKADWRHLRPPKRQSIIQLCDVFMSRTIILCSSQACSNHLQWPDMSKQSR